MSSCVFLLLWGFELSLGEPLPLVADSQTLKAAADALRCPARYRFDAETRSVLAGDPSADTARRGLTRCTFARDGERMGAVLRQWSPDENGAFDAERPQLVAQVIWTGQRFIQFNQLQRGRAAGKGVTSAQPEAGIRRVMGALGGGEALDGYLPGDRGMMWPAILREASSLKESVPSGDEPRVLLEATGTHGHYRIWLNPRDGHTVRRIEVVRKDADLLDGQAVNQTRLPPDDVPLRECRLVVDQIEYQRHGSHRFPISASLERTAAYENGVTLIWREKHMRRNFVVGDEANVDEILLLHAPEGARFSDQDQTQAVHIWQGGQLVRHEWVGDRLVSKP